MVRNKIDTAVQVFILTKYHSLYPYIKERSRFWWYSNVRRLSENIVSLSSLVISKSFWRYKWHSSMISKWKRTVWKYRESEIAGYQKKLSEAERIFFDDIRLCGYQIENKLSEIVVNLKYLAIGKAYKGTNYPFWGYRNGNRLSEYIVNLKSLAIRKISQWLKWPFSMISAFDDIEIETNCLKISPIWNLWPPEKALISINGRLRRYPPLISKWKETVWKYCHS